MARTYDMSTREGARLQTRGQILDAAVELFTSAPYEDVTLGDVAGAAGVSQQTVVNHFGNKIGLYLAGVSERWAPQIAAIRDEAVAGDVGSIVDAALRDYELSGDGTFRTLALSERLEELRPLIESGHRAHGEWVASVLAPRLKGLRKRERDRALALGRAVLDVTTWRHLRRVQGLDLRTTHDHLTHLLDAALPAA
jgi:AcrR family transcriptional regulator